MTAEERLQQIIGAQIVTICSLQAKLEEALKRVEELEKKDGKLKVV